MNNVKTRRIFRLILVLGWMGLIFSFSAQEATVSKELSGGLIETLCRLFVSGFRSLSEQAREGYIEQLQTLVRKCAHFGVYTVLGVFVCNFMSTYSLSRRYINLISAGLCFLYAASDEFHQLFVTGRSGELRDVCIDTLGAMLGVGLYHLLYYVNLKRRSRHSG